MRMKNSGCAPNSFIVGHLGHLDQLVNYTKFAMEGNYKSDDDDLKEERVSLKDLSLDFLDAEYEPHWLGNLQLSDAECTTSSSQTSEEFSGTSHDVVMLPFNHKHVNWEVSGTTNEEEDYGFQGSFSTDMFRTVALNLHFESVALYFRHLVNWSQCGSRSHGLSPVHTSSLLFGEVDALGMDDALTSVHLDCVPDSLQFHLVLNGATGAVVGQRSHRLRKMIEDSLRNRQIHELPGWQSQHRLAIADSDVIARQQEVSRACVLFHCAGPTSLAEVVALQPHQHNSLLRHLLGMEPREATWEVSPQAFEWYRDVQWGSLQRAFAVHAQWTQEARFPAPGVATQHMLLRVWGFAGLMEEAVGHLHEMVSQYRGALADCIPLAGRDYSLAHGGRATATATATAAAFRPRACQPPRNHVASYSFRDREAGIFFFAFESQFRDYMEGALCVSIEAAQANNKPPLNGAESQRNSVLKVSYRGATQASLAAARAYLEQLNPANLARAQIFYPQVRGGKFKELTNQRASQLSMLSAIRAQETAGMYGYSASSSSVGDNASLIDPMKCPGFVNIRMKPTTHACGGVRGIVQPVDCTVTICGSVLAGESQAALLRQVEDAFRAVGSEYLCREVSVSFAHPLKKQLTVRAEREAFVQRHGLVGLKWEEGSRLTGSVGTAKLWAASQDAMDSALSAIHIAEAEGGENTDSGGFMAKERRLWSAAGGAGLSLSCSSISLNGGLTERSTPALTPQSMLYAFGGLLTSRSSSESPRSEWGADSPYGFTAAAAAMAQSVVYWPDDSLRYVLLSDPLSSLLTDLLYRFHCTGVASKYPYRSRANPCAGVLLQGETGAIAEATHELNTFLQTAAKDLQTVLVTMPYQLYTALVGRELAGVKHIQGQAGVRVVLGAKPQEVAAQASSVFDLRLMGPVGGDCISVGVGGVASSEPPMDTPLLTVRVDNAFCGRSIEVAVISGQTSEAGWTWGTNSLLVLIDRHGLAGFCESDVASLQAGEVVVQEDRDTGKTILRAMPVLADDDESTSAELQESAVADAIQRGLLKADQLSLTGVAVAAPTDSESFPALSPDRLRALTVEAVVTFATGARSLLALARIACIELPGATSANPMWTDRDALVAGGGDYMALTILSLAEKQQQQGFPRVGGHNVAGPVPQHSFVPIAPASPRHSKLSVVDMRVALPLSWGVGTASAGAARNRAWIAGGGRGCGYGTQSVMVKGLPCGVLRAVDMMRRMTMMAGGDQTQQQNVSQHQNHLYQHQYQQQQDHCME